jgi:DNA-binding winged helix-turn-helix (wHTH) protein
MQNTVRPVPGLLVASACLSKADWTDREMGEVVSCVVNVPYEFHFGPYRVTSTGGRMFAGSDEIRLGARAREILLVLLEKAGELVSTAEIMRRVWPRSIVEEVALRVHIASLRASLRSRYPETCYVQNVWGQGYRFVAPVRRTVNMRCAGRPRKMSEVPETPSATNADDRPVCKRVNTYSSLWLRCVRASRNKTLSRVSSA